jgi:hypothetical protein
MATKNAFRDRSRFFGKVGSAGICNCFELLLSNTARLNQLSKCLCFLPGRSKNLVPGKLAKTTKSLPPILLYVLIVGSRKPGSVASEP